MVKVWNGPKGEHGSYRMEGLWVPSLKLLPRERRSARARVARPRCTGADCVCFPDAVCAKVPFEPWMAFSLRSRCFFLFFLQCNTSQSVKVSGHLLGEGLLGSHPPCERLELGAFGEHLSCHFPDSFMKGSLNTS